MLYTWGYHGRLLPHCLQDRPPACSSPKSLMEQLPASDEVSNSTRQPSDQREGPGQVTVPKSSTIKYFQKEQQLDQPWHLRTTCWLEPMPGFRVTVFHTDSGKTIQLGCMCGQRERGSYSLTARGCPAWCPPSSYHETEVTRFSGHFSLMVNGFRIGELHKIIYSSRISQE